MPLGRLEPVLEGASDVQMGKLAANTFLPLDVRGDRQYLLSLRHGRLLQRPLLLQLLQGQLHRAPG